MSLDIAVGLAYLTGRVLVPYRFREPRRFPPTSEPGRVPEPPRLPDLFDMPVAWSDEYLLKTWISEPTALHCPWAPVYESVFCLAGEPPHDDVRFRQFRNGRQYVHTFSAEQNDAPDLHISAFTLGHYSYFFHLDDDRRRRLIDVMRDLKPKRPYLEAAADVAASLGSFNAIHIRRGDFVHNELSRLEISRAASIGGEEILANLASRMHRDNPLVICTDGSPEEALFGPILTYFREPIFLHHHLNEHHIRRRLAALPRCDEGVLALLTQLVASKAEVFAGTLFSTFTALIHRLRAWSRGESRALYCYNDFCSPIVRFERCEFLPVDDGLHTWNRIRYPVGPDAYSWLREWPEAAHLAPPSFRSAEDPSRSNARTLELGADEATVHGSGIRHLEFGGYRMIGDWTDSNAFVAWDLQVPAGGAYDVEIRYGCPRASSGSKFRIGVDGCDALEARVWSTGDWASLSPWLPLGQLELPAGPSKLVLRPAEKASAAVMCLSGVRLTAVATASS
jgi:hypothetical protein